MISRQASGDKGGSFVNPINNSFGKIARPWTTNLPGNHNHVRKTSRTDCRLGFQRVALSSIAWLIRWEGRAAWDVNSHNAQIASKRKWGTDMQTSCSLSLHSRWEGRSDCSTCSLFTSAHLLSENPKVEKKGKLERRAKPGLYFRIATTCSLHRPFLVLW